MQVERGDFSAPAAEAKSAGNAEDANAKARAKEAERAQGLTGTRERVKVGKERPQEQVLEGLPAADG